MGLFNDIDDAVEEARENEKRDTGEKFKKGVKESLEMLWFAKKIDDDQEGDS